MKKKQKKQQLESRHFLAKKNVKKFVEIHQLFHISNPRSKALASKSTLLCKLIKDASPKTAANCKEAKSVYPGNILLGILC